MKKQSIMFLILALVASSLLLGAVPPSTVPPSKPKWEYNEVFTVKSLNEMEEKEEGWNVIGFSVDQSMNTHILLKRQKQGTNKVTSPRQPAEILNDKLIAPVP